MTSKSTGGVPETPGAGRPVDFDSFLATLGQKDRTNLTRHYEACEAEPTPDHARLWKRLITSLMKLAPQFTRTTGLIAVQFFVADGRYRQQVFAVEDRRDGFVLLYTRDSLDQAVAAGIISGPVAEEGDVKFYDVTSAPGARLQVEVLTAQRTSGAPEFYKHLLGWNRQAIRITLPVTAPDALVEVTEAICALVTPSPESKSPKKP